MLSVSYADKNAYSASKTSGLLRGVASGANRCYVLAHFFMMVAMMVLMLMKKCVWAKQTFFWAKRTFIWASSPQELEFLLAQMPLKFYYSSNFNLGRPEKITDPFNRALNVWTTFVEHTLLYKHLSGLENVFSLLCAFMMIKLSILLGLMRLSLTMAGGEGKTF